MMEQIPSPLFCRLRRSWVAATPEELVRQQLLEVMEQQLGFPASLMAIEKSLHQMPHLTTEKYLLSSRRADLVCFASDIHSHHTLYPLLLVECKAIPLTQHVISQVAGYNHYVKACYIAVVNQNEVKTGWYDPNQQKYIFVDTLPSYQELLAFKRKI